MKICFPDILHGQHPFIWDYDKDSNRATCTFKLAGSSHIYDKSALIESLKPFKGITLIAEGAAVIEDMSTFVKSYSMVQIHELEENKKLTGSPSKSSQNFFGTQLKSSVVSSQHNASAVATTSSAKSHGIQIDNFINIEYWPTEWGNTLSYLSYFSNKNEIDSRDRRTDLVLSPYDLPKNLQYKKNAVLYPIKQKQIAIICRLFNDILAPYYDDITKEEELPSNLSAFFRTMVEQIMLNKRLNCGPTPTEQLSIKDRNEKFSDSLEFEFSVQQDYISRVNTMLRGLLFFISPKMPANALTEDKTIAKKLESLRSKLSTKDTTVFIDALESLRDLTIEAGKVEYHYELLMQKLNEQLMEKASCIDNVFSCYHLVLQTLHKKFHKEKDTVLISIAESTLALTVIAIRETYHGNSAAKGHIGIPASCHNDFYLSAAVAHHLSKEFEAQSTEICKVKKKDLPEILKDIIMSTIKTELNEIYSTQHNSTHDDETASTSPFNYGV